MTLARLRDTFARIQQETGWDVSKPLLWGYFFNDPERAPLDDAAPALVQLGYRIVNVYLSDKDDPVAPDLWWLHVEKIEIHSPESLLARGERLTEFAKDNGISTYDGWDVGLAVPKAAGNA